MATTPASALTPGTGDESVGNKFRFPAYQSVRRSPLRTMTEVTNETDEDLDPRCRRFAAFLPHSFAAITLPPFLRLLNASWNDLHISYGVIYETISTSDCVSVH